MQGILWKYRGLRTKGVLQKAIGTCCAQIYPRQEASMQFRRWKGEQTDGRDYDAIRSGDPSKDTS